MKTEQKVFLTGATGFLGANLLAEILKNKNKIVYCLVRAEDSQKGFEKIQLCLKKYGIWDNDYSKRIHPVIGNLAEPKLGINKKIYGIISKETENVYHLAAVTDSTKSYEVFKKVNVDGTFEIIKLAYLNRSKIIHYISSFIIFNGNNNFLINEKSIPDINGIKKANSYIKTKWIAEMLLRKMRLYGLPVNIYRTCRLFGSSIMESEEIKYLFWQLLTNILEIKTMCDNNLTLQMLPVSYASKVIAVLSYDNEFLGNTFHLINKQVNNINQIVEWLKLLSHNLNCQSFYQKDSKLNQKYNFHSDNHPFDLIQTKVNLNMSKLDISDSFTRFCLKTKNIKPANVNKILFQLYMKNLQG